MYVLLFHLFRGPSISFSRDQNIIFLFGYLKYCVKKVCRLHCRCIYRNVCPDCKQGEIVTNGGWNHADLTWRLFINEQAREFLDCKTGGSFLSKSVKKSVKRGVRVLHARSARASDALRACEARQKNTYFYRLYPVSLSVFILDPDLLLDCSCLLE